MHEFYACDKTFTFHWRGGCNVQTAEHDSIWCGHFQMKSGMLHSEQKLGKSERQSTSLGNHNYGVVQSETARKILETLDMMTPSPKEKSLDTELALVRERPPTELTASMMNEKARQTMEVESLYDEI